MSHIRRWGAVYLLLLLFAGSWAGQFVTQLADFTSTQQQHGQPFRWNEYVEECFAGTCSNWQREWLQLIFQAILLLGPKHRPVAVAAQDIERSDPKCVASKDRLGLPTP